MGVQRDAFLWQGVGRRPTGGMGASPQGKAVLTEHGRVSFFIAKSRMRPLGKPSMESTPETDAPPTAREARHLSSVANARA